MKKFVSVLLCVILVLSLGCVRASAAGNDYLEATGAVDGTNGQATLVLKASQPLTNAKICVSYDSDHLVCTGAEVSGTVTNSVLGEETVTVWTAVSTSNTIQPGETVATISFDLTGVLDETTVTVTVENWNELIGINETMQTVLTGTGNRFVDVTPDQWFYEAVERMAADGHINGVDANHFGPSLPMNRASFVTLLGRLDGNADTQAQTCFADVPVESFYSGHVLWAYENGITNGSDATHFNPTGSINRAQMVTFLYRYAKYTGGDVSVENVEQILSDYSDSEAVLAITWAAEPFAWAIENGIINGMDGALNPNGTSNRAQVAVMLYRYFYAE